MENTKKISPMNRLHVTGYDNKKLGNFKNNIYFFLLVYINI